MATGIVYTEVDRSADPKIEVSRVKRSLKDGVTKISRTGVRTLANQIAYGNEGGRSLLTLMHKMNNDVLALQKQVDNHNESIKGLTETKDALQKQVDNHNESIKGLTETKDASIKALTETTEALTKEVNTLRPLGENTIEIRKRFFAIYRRRKHRGKRNDRTTIRSGSFAAHDGDVRLDARLFKNGLIEYEDTFLALYGLSWLDAESFFSMFPFSFGSPTTIAKHPNTQPPRICSSLLGTLYSGGCIFGCSAIALFVFLTGATIRMRKIYFRYEHPRLRHR